MAGTGDGVLLREFFRDAICCLYRHFRRHGVPDEVIWDVAKDLALLYHRTRRTQVDRELPPGKLHPAIWKILEDLDREGRR